MVKTVIYGSEEDGSFFVQTSCDEEHFGQTCDCANFGENLTLSEAKRIANQKSKELNVPIEIC